MKLISDSLNAVYYRVKIKSHISSHQVSLKNTVQKMWIVRALELNFRYQRKKNILEARVITRFNRHYN